MKCPHCRKEIDSDPNSPQALFLHIKNKVNEYEKRLQGMKEYHGAEYAENCKWVIVVQKWKAWLKWVGDQIENSQ